MGNCQAVDAAALVIEHPCGKIERLYWGVSASEVMRANPGHYVSLIIPFQVSNHNTVGITQVKLLRPNQTLTLGHAYRLITTQEVMKVLRAKKTSEAMRRQRLNSVWKPSLQSISESGSLVKGSDTPTDSHNAL
ncbi:D-ribose-binding periplasmic protein [Senna tora]|uniref:D-ribose-binding periplasmic protein n=1 Tax=Senna tora TaxID=362788 RepID=A0A834TW17_9FABA|nr:D-ribose-binding periplasmic protein [Senna tora]